MTAPEALDLFTIGHSNYRIEHFLDLLKTSRITCIADVRSRPFSRRFPWFSQPRLRENLEGMGIGYVACGEALGGRPADPALLRDGAADYEAIAATPTFRRGLDAAVAASRGHRLCLMCAEKEPLDCHRCLLVAGALADDGLRIGHILANASVEPHTATEDRLLAATKTDRDLFAETRSDRLAEAYRRRSRTAAFRA